MGNGALGIGHGVLDIGVKINSALPETLGRGERPFAPTYIISGDVYWAREIYFVECKNESLILVNESLILVNRVRLCTYLIPHAQCPMPNSPFPVKNN